jgi:hypothetical protein
MEPARHPTRWDAEQENAWGAQEERNMARIVIRCQHTGHYVFTGFDTQTSPAVVGGRIFCPYCVAEHVWSSTEARLDERERERRHQKPQVRQAS